MTRRPSAPRRVSSKFSLEPRQIAQARHARLSRRALRASGDQRECRPSSGMSSTATGTCHGIARRLSDLCSGICKSLGVSERRPRHATGRPPPGHRVPRDSGARVTRKARPPALTPPSQDIARERVLKVPLVRRIERREIGGLPAIKGLAEAPHVLGNRKIADAHLAQIAVEVAAKRVEQPLPELAAVIAGPGRAGATAAPNAAQSNRIGLAPYRAPR